MDLKRSTLLAAIAAALFASPALAIDWQCAKCCDAAQCCEEAGCCDVACYGEKVCDIEVGGWISGGIYANQYGAKNNGPSNIAMMRDYADGATLDQMWVYAEKKADNGGCGLAFGGRVDFMWGADGPDTQCFGDGGWDGNWMTSDDRNYGSALPQLYAEMAYNDLTVKVGHFYTIIGYEVVPAPDNFFYSHSYTLGIEPFTHMGVLADYSLNDRVTISGGWTNGWDNGWINPTNASTFLGSVSLQLNDDMSLVYATTFGDLAEQSGQTWTTYMQSLVFDWQINCRLEYVLQSDFRTDSDEIGGHVNKYYGINQYFFYTINDCWSAGTRFEWFRGEEDATAYNAAEVTLGLNYKPSDRLTIRPEIRWDSLGGNPANTALVFDGDSRSSEFLGGCDIIYTY